MLHEDDDQQPAPRPAAAPQDWQPEDNDEDAWARVLDCGAPGPAREAPALFYQAAAPARAPRGADHARAS